MYKVWLGQDFLTILTFIWPLWPWPSTYLKCLKWHFSSSRATTVPNCFEIHALLHKVWSWQFRTDARTDALTHVHTPNKNCNNYVLLTHKRGRQKLLKGHNSGKNQSSMTSIKYYHRQVMGTITGKFHQNPLKTLGGVAETRLCHGRMHKPISIVPFD